MVNHFSSQLRQLYLTNLSFQNLTEYVVTNKQLKQMVKFPTLFTRFKLATMTPSKLNTYISK